MLCDTGWVDWGEILFRTAAQVALVAGWLALFIRTNGGLQQAGPILYIPFFLGIPALLVSLVILAPLEGWLRLEIGLGAYPVIVLSGAALPWILILLRRRKGAKDGAIMLSALFGGWALLWVATRPIYAWIDG
jgi:hypothetical protein